MEVNSKITLSEDEIKEALLDYLKKKNLPYNKVESVTHSTVEDYCVSTRFLRKITLNVEM